MQSSETKSRGSSLKSSPCNAPTTSRTGLVQLLADAVRVIGEGEGLKINDIATLPCVSKEMAQVVVRPFNDFLVGRRAGCESPIRQVRRNGRRDSLCMAKGEDAGARGGRAWNLGRRQTRAPHTTMDAMDVGGTGPHLTENQGVGSSILSWATIEALTI